MQLESRSVSIMTSLWGSGNWDVISTRTDIFLFSIDCRLDLGFAQPSGQWTPRALCL